MSFSRSVNIEGFKDDNGYVIEDIWYPRVTSIVNIKAKPALYRFYAELNNFAEGETIKRKSADEGTMVHDMVEGILTGEDVDVDLSIAPAIDAFKNFIDRTPINADKEFIERRVISEDERYAGTVDALAVIGGKFGVLDVKTSQAIYRDYNLQTAAYFATLREQFRNLETRWILRIDQNQKCLRCGAMRRTKGGREKIRRGRYNGYGVTHCSQEEHEWSDMKGEVELKEFPIWQDDYQAFLGAKKLWEWEHFDTLRKIKYL